MRGGLQVKEAKTSLGLFYTFLYCFDFSCLEHKLKGRAGTGISMVGCFCFSLDTFPVFNFLIYLCHVGS